ncbi:MAG: hypothetical protein ACP5O1_09045 [Phycisphaerae bacterium]
MTIQIQGGGIARENAVPANQSCGPSPIARTSPVNEETALWKQAIDQMLAWKNIGGVDNLDDLPKEEIVTTAIDYAVDQIGSGTCAPDSIVPSGGGRIAMEWNNQNATLILEFVDLGIATRTIFNQSGKIIERHTLKRNPKSRQLELRG